MAKKNPKIDTYIAKAAVFARPVLNHLRKLVHQACPGGGRKSKMGYA